MTQNHNTLILAAGNSKFSLPDGNQVSKYEFEIMGERLIQRITHNYGSEKTYLALSNESLKINDHEYPITNVQLGNTKGALISALIAIRDCDLNLPIFITPGDALITKKRYEEFRVESLQTKSEISLVVFDSQNPNYSYVRMLDEKLVEVCEKKVISSKATSGVFFFKSAHLFIQCAEWAIMNNVQTNGLFFLAPALNYAVVKGINPLLFEINENDFFRFSNYNEALESETRFRSANQQN
jgi:hypothetical protein